MNLAVGEEVTFAVIGTVALNATGLLVNTATVTAPPGVDPNPDNDSATDTNNVSTGGIPTTQADLGITKDDGVKEVTPGERITYTIVVTNGGPTAVTGASVTDTLLGSLTGVTWTCVASEDGSACPGGGSGNINATVNLAVGGKVTFLVTGTVAFNPTGKLQNTATVIPPLGWGPLGWGIRIPTTTVPPIPIPCCP